MLKKIIKKILLYFNFNIHRVVKKEKIFNFIKLLKIKLPSNCQLIRIGSNNDGGYLVPDILNEIDCCFSAGIGERIDFEKNLIEKNIECFGVDGNVVDLPLKISNYNFLNKNIDIINDKNHIRFENWINENKPNSNSLIGQIDIEGDEYKLILDTPKNIFNKFKIFVIEFHYLNKISDERICNMYIDAFKKLSEVFNICHIHINNAEYPLNLRNILIPPVLEITFLRKDFYTGDLIKIELPNKLDQKNVRDRKEVDFDENWKNIILH